MAVLEHAVHERTRESADARWGCHNRPPFASGYWAPNRFFFPDGRFEMRPVWVPNVMSTDCMNDVSLTDRKCTECPHRGSGEANSRMVRERGQA